jgi:hypothetical protein
MANTYTLIEAKTLGSNVASVTYSSIPSTFTDLTLLASVRSTRAYTIDDLVIQFNSSSGSHSCKILYGTGASTFSGSTSDIRASAAANNETSNVYSNTNFYIPNYTSANYKSVSADSVNENNATEAWATLTAGLWSSTAAITSITLFANNGNLMAGSTFYLYGISNS